jgi:hypothetical protein
MSLYQMAQQSQQRRRADSNRWTRRDGQSSSEQPARTLDGFPLALLVLALTAAIIPFGYWAALGLLVVVVLTPAVGKR